MNKNQEILPTELWKLAKQHVLLGVANEVGIVPGVFKPIKGDRFTTFENAGYDPAEPKYTLFAGDTIQLDSSGEMSIYCLVENDDGETAQFNFMPGVRVGDAFATFDEGLNERNYVVGMNGQILEMK